MNLNPLPPGVRAETFTYSNGKQETIYLAPYESDGPKVAQVNGSRVLVYMYAAYVFRWRESATKLNIGHGTIDKHMGLWEGVPISGKWHPDTLTQFAQQWAHKEFRKYAK
ncbi:MAG: hypothetical protein GEU86_11050 [Actinophytocola sp.]|nr:hypothetical protein [Actinophytocola sp.]